MNLIGLEISDAGIMAVQGRDLLAVDGQERESPGFALPEKKRIVVGHEAQKQAHLLPQQVTSLFWEQLSPEPVKQVRRGRFLSNAEIAYAHLSRVWENIKHAGDRVVLAVPGYFTKEQLGLMLGMLMELPLSVAGMVSLAVAGASIRGTYPDCLLVHLDMHLHRTVVTFLEQGKYLTEKDSVSLPGKGLEFLCSEWANAVAQEYLRATRFDPFHNAYTEQELYNRLPGALAGIQDIPGGYDFELSGGGRTHRVTLQRAVFMQKSEPLFWEICSALSSIRARYGSAGQKMVIQLTHRVSRVPGIAAMLAGLPDTEVVALAPGASASGAVELEDLLLQKPVSRGVSFLTSKPWQTSLAPSETCLPGISGKTREIKPTHILYQNIAKQISKTPLLIGQGSRIQKEETGMGEDIYTEAETHFSVELQGQDVVLRNFSPDGTFVNGVKVEGTVTLRLGQVIQLNKSGQEFRMIACFPES